MSPVLADTSVWMRRAQPEVASLLAEALESGTVVMSTPIELELLRTARNVRELGELTAEYGVLRHVVVDRGTENRALEIQATLARRGYHRGPSPVDLLAAAAAERADAELWHCDRHFELIAAVTGQPIRKVGR